MQIIPKDNIKLKLGDSFKDCNDVIWLCVASIESRDTDGALDFLQKYGVAPDYIVQEDVVFSVMKAKVQND